MRLALVLAVLLAATGARADVVFPEPESCPPGAISRTGHMGPHCLASTCEAPADCRDLAPRALAGASFECASAGLCVSRRAVHVGRGRSGEVPIALGSCSVDADCEAGVRCELATRCIAPGSVPGPVPAAFVPRVWAPAVANACGALGMIGLLVIALAASGLVVRARARERRRLAVRTLVESRGRASDAELVELAGDVASVARALAPLAHRVRVEIDDDGETVYTLDDDDEASERREKMRA